MPEYSYIPHPHPHPTLHSHHPPLPLSVPTSTTNTDISHRNSISLSNISSGSSRNNSDRHSDSDTQHNQLTNPSSRPIFSPGTVHDRTRPWLRRHSRASSEDRRTSHIGRIVRSNVSLHNLAFLRPLDTTTPASSGGSVKEQSERSPASVKTFHSFRPSISRKRPTSGLDTKHVTMGPELDSSKLSGSFNSGSKQIKSGSLTSRTESLSSTSVHTSVSHRTVTSTDQSETNTTSHKQFTQRNGRTYLSDPSLPYVLPVDLAELHRQSLRTMLLIQVHGAPVMCPQLIANPPKRVLEIGCGPGFWSMMCHRFFKGKGHSGIEFVGMDIVQLGTPSDVTKPDSDMNWTFIQHDVRQPWPFEDGEFDLVFNKDMTLAVDQISHQAYTEETIRVIKPGGVLEIWETDHMIRMLRPHAPNVGPAYAAEQEAAVALGAYIINLNTPLSAPLNTYLVEFNSWIQRALETRKMLPNPCTIVNHHLLQESETLKDMGSHRVAIPLSEIRWEREGVGGVVTKDGKSYVEMKGDLRPKVDRKSLTVAQAALRQTALATLVEEIQALEPMLREVSGKSQDEWDLWLGKMMVDLMSDAGASWGECLETGAWWATKKAPSGA